jgi:uncharacterized membrane protein
MMHRAGLLLFSAIFVFSGLAHLLFPAPYVRIVPPFLPNPKALVLISGVAELLGGLAILWPNTQRIAAYGLAILLVAVFPANIYMAVGHVRFQGWLGNTWVQWLRLPLQIPLIWWALQYINPDSLRQR